MADARSARSGLSIAVLGGLSLVSVIAFMMIDANGRWDLALRYRLDDLIALLLVGYAVGLSSVLFQTVTNNRILTPGVMGFDALFVVVQFLVVLALSELNLRGAPPAVIFAIEVLAMIGLSAGLYSWLLGDGRRGVHLLVLTGVVLGLFFRSLTAFSARLLDPGDAVAGGLGRAFASPDHDMLAVAIVVVAASTLAAWWVHEAFDVLNLGRETAIGLGVDHRRVTNVVLVISAALASISTAFAGPMVFLGLLAANLAYLATGTSRHRATLPAAVLVAILCLVAGRVVLENFFGAGGDVTTLVNLFGGLTIIVMLMRGSAR